MKKNAEKKIVVLNAAETKAVVGGIAVRAPIRKIEVAVKAK